MITVRIKVIPNKSVIIIPITKLAIVKNPNDLAKNSRINGTKDIIRSTHIAIIQTKEYFIGNLFLFKRFKIITNHIIENISKAILNLILIIFPSFLKELIKQRLPYNRYFSMSL